MQQGDLPLKDSQKRAFFVSATLHVIFLLFLAAQGLFAPPVQRVSKKLLVQSIALKTGSSQNALPRKSSFPSQQGIAFSEGPSSQPEKPASVEEKPSPVEENGMPEPYEENVSAREEAPSEKPIATPSTEESPPQPISSTPKKTPKISKATAKTKTQPTPKHPQKVTPSSSTKKRTPPSSAKKGTTTSAPSYNKRLVAEALSRLDRSVKATKGSASSEGSSGHGCSGKKSRVGSVGALHSDTGVSVRGSGGGVEGGVDGGMSEYGPTTTEGCYIADLIRRLQLNIRLAEPGEVRIKLTLKKGGTISSVVVVSCRNEKIRSSLLEKLKKVHFSPFGQSFPGEAEHTFLLRLSNELTWSCS